MGVIITCEANTSPHKARLAALFATRKNNMVRPMIRMSESSQDDTIVQMDADQLAVAKKEIGEIWSVLKSLSHHIEKGDFTVAIRDSHCGCLESFAARFCKAVGHDEDIEKQRWENARAVREANLEIRRLEQLVGSSRGFDGVPDMIALMRESFKDFWWNAPCGSLVYDSPGHGAAGSGNGGGFYPARGQLWFTAELIPGFSGEGDEYFDSSMSDTPVSDKEKKKNWIEQLGEKIDLHYPEKAYSSSAEMLDTPRNREYIENMLQTRFPSLRIDAWGIQSVYGDGKQRGLMQIRWFKITIENTEEMLPTEEETKRKKEKEEKWKEQRGQ